MAWGNYTKREQATESGDGKGIVPIFRLHVHDAASSEKDWQSVAPALGCVKTKNWFGDGRIITAHNIYFQKLNRPRKFHKLIYIYDFENNTEIQLTVLRNREMWDGLITILSAITIGPVSWAATVVKRRISEAVDRRKVHKWLQLNTWDEPSESHVDTNTLAKGTRITEERVRKACMTDLRIYHFADDTDQWSIWQEKPKSVYNKRGLRVL